jgi:DNA-binding SARP family transcriptional activator
MEFRVLGPLEVARDGEALPLGGAKQRAALALLLMHANEPIGAETLVDRIWGERPPATAGTALQGYVSALRRVLEPERPKGAPPQVLATAAAG